MGYTGIISQCTIAFKEGRYNKAKSLCVATFFSSISTLFRINDFLPSISISFTWTSTSSTILYLPRHFLILDASSYSTLHLLPRSILLTLYSPHYFFFLETSSTSTSHLPLHQPLVSQLTSSQAHNFRSNNFLNHSSSSAPTTSSTFTIHQIPHQQSHQASPLTTRHNGSTSISSLDH